MAKVICTLPNTADVVNGVKFTLDRGEMISEDVSDEVAAAFAVIPGYTVAGAGKAAADKGKGKAEPAAPAA